MLELKDIENMIDWDFFYELLSTYLPSNYEEESIIFLKKKLQKYNLKGNYTKGGDVIVNMNKPKKSLNNLKTDPRNKGKIPSILIDAHLDEIHLRIINISDDGYLIARPFGTIVQFLLGKRVVIHSSLHKKINGVIIIPPAHFVKKDIKDINEINNMIEKKYLWIDIGTNNKLETQKIVSIGDPITFPIEINTLQNNCIVSKGLDNRIGAFVLTQVLKILNDTKMDNYQIPNIIANFSNREEIGHAVYLREENMNLDYIMVIDTNIDTSTPVSKSSAYTPVIMGEGPVISKNLETTPRINNELEKICEKIKLPYQLAFNSHLGGTNLFSYRKYNTETLFLGIAIRNIHSSVESCKIDDIKNLIVLVLNYLLSL